MRLRARATLRVDRLAIGVMAVACAACVVRTERSEHYIGPVLLRASDACRDNATAVESLQLGVGSEFGAQTGISVGFAERVAIAARINGTERPRCDRWTLIGGLPDPIDANRWTFSAFYARREMSSSPEFVYRLLVGAQAAAGSELSALSVGVVSRTALQPRGDGYYSFKFDTSRPIASRFEVHPYQPGAKFPLLPIPEEESEHDR